MSINFFNELVEILNKEKQKSFYFELNKFSTRLIAHKLGIGEELKIEEFCMLIPKELGDIKEYQILFDIENDSLIHTEIRINENVKGKIFAHMSYEYQTGKMLINPQETYLYYLELNKEDMNKNHITAALQPGSRSCLYIMYDITIKNKNFSNFDKENYYRKFYMTEKEFLEHLKQQGLGISRRTLYNYMNYLKFNPHKVKVNNNLYNLYNPTWSKIIREIKEKKPELKEKGININRIKTLFE